MPCRYCHKPKFAQGRRYSHFGDEYILVNTGVGYCLVNLSDGNRWQDPVGAIEDVDTSLEFREIKEKKYANSKTI